jgi:glycosyltransferase involved in cell wall biosynthesis
MIVGIVSDRYEYYPYTRNIVGIVPDAEYKKVQDFFLYAHTAARKLNQMAKKKIIPPFDLTNQFYDFNRSKVDVLHLFNGVSYGTVPWVSTFETILPRFRKAVDGRHGFWSDRKIRKALAMLADASCKRIISLSECGANMERSLLADFSDIATAVEKKMVVMHPPQVQLVSQFADKQIGVDGTIRFMFVGSAFFRKGGREIIETFKNLREKQHYNIELIIVSSLKMESYAAQEKPEDIQWAAQIIRENGEWIKYFPRLSNPEVLRLMRESHIGLLPTYADTYGYSVLEFQASGCPVISTNVRALPEINSNENGWLIEVPKNRLGEAIYTTTEDRQILSSAIRKGLENAVHEIFADRSTVLQKSEKAITRIKEHHSVTDFASRMRKIYLDAA